MNLKKSLLDSVFLPMKKSLLLISNLPSSSVSRSLKKKKKEDWHVIIKMPRSRMNLPVGSA